MSMITESIQSFKHAIRGLLLAFRTERSFRLQAAAALVVVLLCLVVPFKGWERALLLLATASVLVLELINSMVERLIDLVKPRMHLYVRDIKDLMAAAVLVASLFAAALGVLILWPYIGTLLGRV